MDDKRTKRQKTGAIGESIAEQFLRSKGYKIFVKNYRKPWGEIDIIAEKGNTIRFVEVKTVSRESRAVHRPEELVDRRKLSKVARTAALYMEMKRDRRESIKDSLKDIHLLAEMSFKLECPPNERVHALKKVSYVLVLYHNGREVPQTYKCHLIAEDEHIYARGKRGRKSLVELLATILRPYFFKLSIVLVCNE